MTDLLIVFVMMLLLPLFVASWRVSLLGLSGQGLLMAWMVSTARPRPRLDVVATLLDLAWCAAWSLPLALYGG